MRASKGYVVGLGTTSALVAAIACAFAIVSAVMAVRGWTGSTPGPPVTTLDGGAGPLAGDAVFASGLVVAPAAGGAAPNAEARSGRIGDDGRGAGTGAFAALPAAPVATVPGTRVEGTVTVPGANAAGTTPPPGTAAPVPAPVPAPAPGSGAIGGGGGSGGQTGSGSGGGNSSPPSSPPGDLGGTVVQITSGTGAAVTQTGQQLGGAVKGTTGQLGATVGQVSPAAGQVVTQTGQVAGGVVSGATGTVGQVVQGAGATVGGLLRGLGSRAGTQPR